VLLATETQISKIQKASVAVACPGSGDGDGQGI
jgi:hypothetical protein